MQRNPGDWDSWWPDWDKGWKYQPWKEEPRDEEAGWRGEKQQHEDRQERRGCSSGLYFAAASASSGDWTPKEEGHQQPN